MRNYALFLWAFALFFLQQSFASIWNIDLGLIFVSLVGLRSNPLKAATVGFGLGLAQDLLSAGFIGPNLLAKILVSLVSVAAQGKIYRERVSTQSLLILFNITVQQAVIWLLMKWDGKAPALGDALWVALPSIFLTTLVGAVVCFGVVRLRRRRFDPATA